MDDAPQKKTLGSYLRELLSQHDLSQRELSRLTAYSSSEINRWIRDKKPPTIDALATLACVLGRGNKEREEIAGKLVLLTQTTYGARRLLRSSSTPSVDDEVNEN